VATYSFELKTPTTDGPGVESNVFTLSTSDGTTSSANATLTVNITDDVPAAITDRVELAGGSITPEKPNILMILDFSASMQGNNFSALKAGLTTLAEAYEARGGFTMEIVGFGGSATGVKSTNGTTFTPTTILSETFLFTTAAQVKAFINSIANTTTALDPWGPGSGTNYDAAVLGGVRYWDYAKSLISGETTGNSVAYFISDGAPSTTANQLDATQQSNWETYVNNNFSKSIAIGIGASAPADADLQTVAHTPGGPSGNTDDTIYGASTTDNSALIQALLNALNSVPTVSSGNLLPNDVPGADAPLTLVSVTYGSTTVTFNSTTTSASFVTAAGSVVINNTGGVTITGVTGNTTGLTDSISYIVKDADGDVATSTLVINQGVTLIGTNAVSTLTGSSYADVLYGGLGSDSMTGGAGADRFLFLKGQGSAADIDTITDFTTGVDSIVVQGSSISQVQVSAATVTGSGATTVRDYTVTITYIDGTANDTFKIKLTNNNSLTDGNKTGTIATPNGIQISSTSATIDGTIVGATLYIDINQNNQEDSGERLGVTDAKGHVEWVVDLGKLDVNGDGQYTLGEARAVQSGGLDVDTGLTYEINLYGQVGASIVSPLTSLLQTLLESGSSLASANAELAQHLGLPVGADLTSLNPIEGSHQVLVQNAAVMTAAVQFSELAALHLATDEGHASFAVFQAISTAITALSDGQVADFSDATLLQSISSHLGLSDFAGQDVVEFMVASQLALQHSIDSLQPGDNSLAAISAVQQLTQGSYADVLQSVATGDLSVHALDDLTHTLTAYSQGDISISQLSSFDHALNAANADDQITDLEFTQALTTLPGHTEPAALVLVADDVHALVDNFLTNLHTNDSDGTVLSHNDVVYELDVAVSAFITDHGITADQYHDIHQQVIDHIAQDLQDHGLVDSTAIQHDPAGHADGSDVIAALDTHFQDLYDTHVIHDVHVDDYSSHV
ncbi:hypothetical protein, partial [Cyanobium sp. Morenito 9A2]|uniref:hypothetical protein n=1 Tax=Cyanobium sp. Morenito 9A2 TaxID=2823718 RepID=UPI0020CBBE8F|nr:hypothetical protein [Cyanobium sp. Morenito 9A2]